MRDYAAVGFSGLSALFAFLLLVPVLQGETISVYNSVIPASVPWISELGINIGVLYDPFTIIIVNVVTPDRLPDHGLQPGLHEGRAAA